MELTEVTALDHSHVEIPFELEALANALRYQQWVYDIIRDYLGKRVLEIGAGVGNISRWLTGSDRLILTEADPMLLKILRRNIAAAGLPEAKVRIESYDVVRDSIDGYVAENPDTVVSFNVLEHIENDGQALRNLCDIMRQSSSPAPRRLVCFVPAHAWAYGTMDEHFGHFRRYSAGDFRKLARQVAPEAKLELRYFNLFGLFGWILQGRILKKTSFGLGSIHAFEALCPVIRPIDDFIYSWFRLPFGQSLLAVLEWPARPAGAGASDATPSSSET